MRLNQLLRLCQRCLPCHGPGEVARCYQRQKFKHQIRREDRRAVAVIERRRNFHRAEINIELVRQVSNRAEAVLSLFVSLALCSDPIGAPKSPEFSSVALFADDRRL